MFNHRFATLVVLGMAAWVLALCPAHAEGRAEPLTFRHLTVEDGLSHIMPTAFVQDHRGFMWIGTALGLNRYDGYSFRWYHATPDDTTSLNAHHITALFEDQEKQLWIGTTEGLCRYVRALDHISCLSPETVPAFDGGRVWTITQGPDGSLWLGTTSGLYRMRWDRRDIERMYAPPSGDVQDVAIDGEGRLWIVAGRLLVYDPDAGEVRRPFAAAARELEGVMGVEMEVGGWLWVGTAERGVCRLDVANGADKNLHCYRSDDEDPTSLATDEVHALYVDRQQRLWVALVNAGLDLFDSETESFVHHAFDPDDPHSLNNNSIYALYQDRAGELWVGTHAGGANVSRRNGRAFGHFRSEPGDGRSLSYNVVTAFAETQDTGVLWVATDGGGLNRLDLSSEEFVHFRSETTGLRNDAIITLYPDRDGGLWLGTWGGGVQRFDPASGRFDPLTALNEQLPEPNVRAFAEDHEGYLWLGLDQEGLLRYDRKTGRVSRPAVEPESRIATSRIRTIVPDEAGALLVGTRSGLYRLDLLSGTMDVVAGLDGLDVARLDGSRLRERARPSDELVRERRLRHDDRRGRRSAHCGSQRGAIPQESLRDRLVSQRSSYFR